jgi:hypothetical protein
MNAAGGAPSAADAPRRDARAVVTDPVTRARRAPSAAMRPVPWGRVSLVLAIGVFIAGFLWLVPYRRSLVVWEGEGRSVVAASCPVPINAALAGSTDRSLDADGEWTAGSPPCARSARFRLGLGAVALLAAAGGAAALTSRARSRTFGVV